jgi:predicted nuclease with TOPRIM domain
MSAQMDQLEDVKAALTEELDKRQTHVQELLASEEALQAELEVGRQRLDLHSEERGALAEDMERQLRHAEDSIAERLQQVSRTAAARLADR